MKSIQVRDLRSKSAQIWKELAQEKDMIVTSKGRPIGILSTTSEETLTSTIKAVRRARATLGLLQAQMDSVKRGLHQMSLEKINKVIANVRKSRKVA